MGTEDIKRKLYEFKEAANTEIETDSEVGEYLTPLPSLLSDPVVTASSGCSLSAEDVEAKLAEFGVQGKVEDIKVGPLVSRYEIRLAAGVRLSQIQNLSEDLAVALKSNKVRIEAPIPGTSLVGIEIGNDTPAIIPFKKVVDDIAVLPGEELNPEYELPVAIGTDTLNKNVILELTKMPHLLIAGQTGSGKSVGLQTILMSIIYTKQPNECQLVLVDPKRVEMASYSALPHLRYPIINEPEKAVEIFDELVREMEARYEILAQAKVRNIKGYNEANPDDKMPYIVVVVDEMADLMMSSPKQLEKSIVRLAQLARAVGIHLVLATQKPTVKVITGLIKSNMPSRISFLVASKNDSRVILDRNGAEKLLGRGDMLVLHPGNPEPERVHGAWISDKDISEVLDFIKVGMEG